jgi:hypothetical protein
LGHIIADGGFRPDLRKVKSVEEFPTPKNAKKLGSFLGLADYYSKFAPKFSKITAPLHKLLKENVKFEWTEEQELAFGILKQKLLSKYVLQYMNISKEPILTTDASIEGVGAELSKGIVGKNRPIAYASRSFSKAYRN